MTLVMSSEVETSLKFSQKKSNKIPRLRSDDTSRLKI
jgi:hypothetical protein